MSGNVEQPVRDVIVIGGGLAGISASCALASAGFNVKLLERRGYLGGRASSYEHPGTGEVIDNCQHVLLGCCTNLIDLYGTLGVQDRIRWFDRLTFIEPGGRESILAPSGLPAPLHTSLSFLGAHAFSMGDKLAIGRALMTFMRGIPPDTGENFADWLKRHGQTKRAIERFWLPIIVSALNEDLDRVSVHYAGQVIRESFLKSAGAGQMGVPGVPLSELYSRASGFMAAHNGQVVLRAQVEQVFRDEKTGRWAVTVADGVFEADAVICALSFEAMAKLLPNLPVLEAGQGANRSASEHLAFALSQFEHSPITGIHLWFDREITRLPHAVLLDRTIQWLFNKSVLQPERAAAEQWPGSYVELVVSASRELVKRGQQEILDLAVRELGEFFPAVAQAKLVKGAVVKDVRATYSIRPGLDAIRPGAATAWPGLYLAGDWTATGWPATMEGAVRSGRLAAEALCRDGGDGRKILVSDLASGGLMKAMG